MKGLEEKVTFNLCDSILIGEDIGGSTFGMA